MKENDKIWQIIGIIFIVYLIIWLWPVVFHRPFFNSNNGNIPVDISPRPPMNITVPTNGNFKAYPLPEGNEYTYPTPVTETPYDPSQPDPVAPPHSADEPGDQVACTMEAKQCPDGSYIGRQGPNCEFAPCPGN
ncbi:MAG: hypothetical protein V4469_04095 [Patescibacteria group bacterium]